MLNLKLNCPTRWNSDLAMLERMIHCWTPLSIAAKKYPKYAKDIPSEHVDSINNLIQILKPIDHITNRWSSENKVVISEVFIHLNSLIKKTEETIKLLNNEDPLRPFALSLVDGLKTKTQFEDFRNEKLVQRACILDPRFKGDGMDSKIFENAKSDSVAVSKKIKFRPILHRNRLERWNSSGIWQCLASDHGMNALYGGGKTTSFSSRSWLRKSDECTFK